MFNIIDGTYLLYRAYFVAEKYKPGKELHLFYGLINKFKENTAIVFDTDSDNFRHRIFPRYKEGREPRSKKFLRYRKKAQKLAKYMGFAIYMVEGYEGDDIIGTLANQATKRKIKTTIHTGDKDIAQFVSKYVSLYDTKFKRETTLKTLKTKQFMTPKQVPSYLALLGDKIDNIPGVKGIGHVTAIKLLDEFGDAKTIRKKRRNIKGATGTKITANLDNLKLSYKLAKGITVPGISIDNALKPLTVNREKVKKLLTVKGNI